MTTRDVWKLRQERLREHYGGDASNFSAEVLDEAPADRYKKIVAMNVQLRRELIEGPTYCRRCWTHNVHCVCSIIPTLDYPHRVVLVMHSKEYGRMTNTGKLIVAMLPNSVLLIADDTKDEERLRDELERARGRCALLFPSASSITVPEFLARAAASQTRRSDSGAATGAEPLTLVVVDGTWAQARRMEKNIPSDVPRVIITPVGPSINLQRQQSRHDRISTLEATAMLLQEVMPDSEVPAKMIDILRDVVVAQLHVSGKFTYFKTLLANPEESLVNPLRLPRPAPRGPADVPSAATVWIDTPFDHLSLDDPPAPAS